jgi:hypothetical protein
VPIRDLHRPACGVFEVCAFALGQIAFVERLAEGVEEFELRCPGDSDELPFRSHPPASMYAEISRLIGRREHYPHPGPTSERWLRNERTRTW